MPNYVFCLAHFCEIHGPSTILCTQRQTADAVPPSSAFSSCESCSLLLPNDTTSVLTTIGDLSRDSKPVAKDHFHDQNLPDSELYISTRYPHRQKLYTCLMKLVMRCLSVEAVADPSKPLFHGDVANGYCISKVFSVPDIHARGGERKYALLVACDSEASLLSAWELVLVYVTDIISLIQRKVEDHLEESRRNGVDNERYLRRSKIVPKNLVELTNDKEIFLKLHTCGIHLLRDIV